jgi:hypothetical protein
MVLYGILGGILLDNKEKIQARARAKNRCDGFFGTDKNLRKGCRNYIKTLDNPDDFIFANQYLETMNQQLLISTYGIDLVQDDDITTETVFGSNSTIYFVLGALILALLIYLLWIQ